MGTGRTTVTDIEIVEDFFGVALAKQTEPVSLDEPMGEEGDTRLGDKTSSNGISPRIIATWLSQLWMMGWAE